MLLVFVAKLVLVPALIAAITIAGTRFGPRVAGTLTGLPVVAGPIVLVVTIEQGAAFAARSATATLTGLVSLAVFCIVYAWTAPRTSWWASVTFGWLAFLAATFVLDRLALGLPAAIVTALATPPVMLAAMPELDAAPQVDAEVGAGEVGLRMLAGIALMLAVTGIAQALGPRLSGLLTVFPIATTVLAVFSHRNQGVAFATRLLRGLALGLYSLGAFFTTLALGLEAWGTVPAFLLAVTAALVAQSVVLTLYSQA